MPGTALIRAPARDLDPAASGEVVRLAAAAAAYADAAMAPATRRAYESSWRAFEAWCDTRRTSALPTSGRTVALYLTELAPAKTVATLGRHLAAIRAAHKLSGEPDPGGPELARIWAGIRRTHGRPPAKKRALVTDDLKRIVKKLRGPGATRDKALLLVGFAAALRRSELVALNLDANAPARLSFVCGGLEVRLAKSKTDQEGRGQVVAIPHGKTALCPVKALEEWLRSADIRAGPVFRAVDRHGRVGKAAIGEKAAASIVKKAAARAGFAPAVFGAHSLRAGFVTEAARAGVAIELIMRQTRHTRSETVVGYIREVDLFKRNAAAKVGL